MTRGRRPRGPLDPKMDRLSWIDRWQTPLGPRFAVPFRTDFGDRFLNQFLHLFRSILGPKMVKKRPQNDFRHQPSTENRKTQNLMTLSMKIATFRSEIGPKINHFDAQMAFKTGLQKTAEK